jgi:hypothetical protein
MPKAAAQHKQKRQIIAQAVVFPDGFHIGLRRKFCGHRDSGHNDIFRRDTAGDEARLRFIRRHAIHVHARIHPERVRFKIRHDGADERLRRFFLFAKQAEQFVRQKVGTEDGVRLEVLQMLFEFVSRRTGEGARPFVQSLHELRIIRLAEKHSPKFRRAFHEFYIAVRVNFFVERREELDEVHAVNSVARPQGAPGFVQGRCRGVMARAGGDGGNENTHRGSLPDRGGVEKEKGTRFFFFRARGLGMLVALVI